jgi:hypothetical protein
VNCGSELLDVVWHPEPETSYPADPPKCTQAAFDPPKCTEAEIDPPNGRSLSKIDQAEAVDYRCHVVTDENNLGEILEALAAPSIAHGCN